MANLTDRAAARRVLTASLVGTSVEFYDFYIYATAAALVFGPQFFPASSPSAQLMQSYATFALAFIARPLLHPTPRAMPAARAVAVARIPAIQILAVRFIEAPPFLRPARAQPDPVRTR